MTDPDLLHRFTTTRDPAAFTELVARHARLVHASALRQTRDAHLADDITQAVFILLARKAHKVPPNHLAGWLVKTAHYASRDARRARDRRTRHEQKAATMNPDATTPAGPSLADDIAPHLDAALARLPQRTRTAVCLRYLENLSLADVGRALNLSENGAQKLIARALPKLRRLLTARGLTLSLTPATLATALQHLSTTAPGPHNLDALAPTALAAATATTALAATSAATIANGAAKLMAIAKLQATAAAVTLTLIATTAAVAIVRQTTAPTVATTQPAPAPRLQLRLVADPAHPSTAPTTAMPDASAPQNPPLQVENEIYLDNAHVASAETQPTAGATGYQVSITFTPAGADRFEQLTSTHLGRRLAIVFDGKILSAPTIRSTIRAAAVITGGANGLTKAEADAVVAALNHARPPATAPTTQAAAPSRIVFRFTAAPSVELAFDTAKFLIAHAHAAGPTSFVVLEFDDPALAARTPQLPADPRAALSVDDQRLAEGALLPNPGTAVLRFATQLPFDQARAVADRLNRAAPDNPRKRLVARYTLPAGEVLRLVPPADFPPERLRYSGYPERLKPTDQLVFEMLDGVPRWCLQFPGGNDNRPVGLQLISVVQDALRIHTYEFDAAPNVRQISLPGDWLVRRDADAATKLAALQRIVSANAPAPLKVELRTVNRPAVVVTGRYTFTPLAAARNADALHLATGKLDPPDREGRYGNDTGDWPEFLARLGDQFHVRFVSLAESPPPRLRWIRHESFYAAARPADQPAARTPAINACLDLLASQTGLDFTWENRPQEVYFLTAAP